MVMKEGRKKGIGIIANLISTLSVIFYFLLLKYELKNYKKGKNLFKLV